MGLPTEADFEDALDDLKKKKHDISVSIDKCIDKVTNYDFGCAKELFDQDTIDKINATMKELNKAGEDFTDALAKLASPGNPFWFLNAQKTWDSVLRQLTGQTSLLTDHTSTHFPASTSWVGGESEAYCPMPGVQAGAIGGTAVHAGAFATHLGAHGVSICQFWMDIAEKLINTAMVVTGSVAEFLTADPTKWLSIITTVVKVVNTLIADALDALKLIEGQWLKTIGEMSALNSALNDVTGSINGQWPTIERSVA